jgi:putative transposase
MTWSRRFDERIKTPDVESTNIWAFFQAKSIRRTVVQTQADQAKLSLRLAAIAEVCRKAGISDATFYNWRKKYAGLMPSEMRRLRQLEEENTKLKRIVADLSLDKAMLQDVLSKKL